jgi:hypothetical protein
MKSRPRPRRSSRCIHPGRAARAGRRQPSANCRLPTEISYYLSCSFSIGNRQSSIGNRLVLPYRHMAGNRPAVRPAPVAIVVYRVAAMAVGAAVAAPCHMAAHATTTARKSQHTQRGQRQEQATHGILPFRAKYDTWTVVLLRATFPGRAISQRLPGRPGKAWGSASAIDKAHAYIRL